jgi:hypothetical protein
MNDKVRQLLSAYLDGQATAAEKERVETVLQRDPAVRAELDAMRAFTATLNQAAPVAVAAPPELRARIMDRLKSQGGGQAQGGSGGALLPLAPLKAFLLVGVVLVGLIGTLIYLDQKRGPLIPARPAAGDLALSGPAAGSSPETGVHPAGADNALRPANPEDIRSAVRPAEPGGAGKQMPRGRVYTFGQGGVISREGSALPVAGEKQGREDISPAGVAGAAAELESSSGWTSQRLAAADAAGKMVTAEEAQAMLDLARRYNLNPGLLSAARREFPERSLTEMAMAMRSSLNATRGQAADRRLTRLIADLGGQLSWAARWKKQLHAGSDGGL